MELKAIILLDEAGLPICRKTIKLKELPMEPLVAAIIGLANEMGAGDISHAKFENFSIVFVRGCINKELILSLITDRVDHLYYLQAIYLMNKLEKKIPKIGYVVGDRIRKQACKIIEDIIPYLTKIPDFIGESLESALSLLGPFTYSSLMFLLYRKFDEDPLITLIKNPKKFYKETKSILGTSLDIVIRYAAKFLVNNYKIKINP